MECWLPDQEVLMPWRTNVFLKAGGKIEGNKKRERFSWRECYTTVNCQYRELAREVITSDTKQHPYTNESEYLFHEICL